MIQISIAETLTHTGADLADRQTSRVVLICVFTVCSILHCVYHTNSSQNITTSFIYFSLSFSVPAGDPKI